VLTNFTLSCFTADTGLGFRDVTFGVLFSSTYNTNRPISLPSTGADLYSNVSYLSP
jgi:hypothetical protein